ncbi:hypothetical protein CF65_00382 [Aggregatibacter actinomycetemcomitans HK1651]|nr:hypothetical protein CF65_00382 [Aggregatibacter actinomycetemcomitans HK1651]
MRQCKDFELMSNKGEFIGIKFGFTQKLIIKHHNSLTFHDKNERFHHLIPPLRAKSAVCFTQEITPKPPPVA